MTGEKMQEARRLREAGYEVEALDLIREEQEAEDEILREQIEAEQQSEAINERFFEQGRRWF